jgi:hypothetical protein
LGLFGHGASPSALAPRLEGGLESQLIIASLRIRRVTSATESHNTTAVNRTAMVLSDALCNSKYTALAMWGIPV